MRYAFRTTLRLFRLLIVIIAFVVLLADAGEVTFLLVLVALGVALGKEDLGVHELVEVGTLIDIRYPAFDVLLFKIEYLILCNLATKI